MKDEELVYNVEQIDCLIKRILEELDLDYIDRIDWQILFDAATNKQICMVDVVEKEKPFDGWDDDAGCIDCKSLYKDIGDPMEVCDGDCDKDDDMCPQFWSCNISSRLTAGIWRDE